jgi:hypothetical protein
MISLTADGIAHFRAFGFLVLRDCFDAAALSDEVNRTLDDGVRSSFDVDVAGGISFSYVPMMCEHTPGSLSLLDTLAQTAAELLDRSVLPVRAKATRYAAGAGWHCDSDLDMPSVGFLAYLEPLRANTGALRVLPGSHRPAFSSAVAQYLEERRGMGVEPDFTDFTSVPGLAVDTDPGDIIVFDEHIYHGSAGGSNRRQWRVDYIPDPIGEQEERVARRYLEQIFPPDWAIGYDAERYPSYGEHWIRSERPCATRLGELGVYARAAAFEGAE